MVNIEACCARDGAEPSAREQRALRKAMKRAAKAQRRLNEAIYISAAGGGNTATSSSESDEEEARGTRGCRNEAFAGRHGPFSESCRMRSHPYHFGPWAGRHGPHGAHGPWASMRGFPPGRHTMGFPRFGAFPGMMPHGMGPHSHPHHHHHRGPFGAEFPFGGHGGHCGRFGGHKHGHGYGHGHGHGHGPAAGPFGRHFQHFGMGHASGRRERAHSVPVV